MVARQPMYAERLPTIVQRLVDTLKPERIYLFGSQARGDAGDDSDLDLLVIVDSSDEPRYRRAQAAHLALADIGLAVDVLVFTRAEFEREEPVAASLPATVSREGRLLYAA